MDEFVAVYIAPGLVRYVIKTNPAAAEFVDSKGRLLVRLKKALYHIRMHTVVEISYGTS